MSSRTHFALAQHHILEGSQTLDADRTTCMKLVRAESVGVNACAAKNALTLHPIRTFQYGGNSVNSTEASQWHHTVAAQAAESKAF